MSDPVTDYANRVLDGSIPSCRYVKLACERHLTDLEREWEYTFKPELAEKFFKFCSYLNHYKGSFQGSQFDLLEWQKFVYGSIYGWVDAKGNWRFKTAYIEVPRKNGKTTMASATACFDSAFIERQGCEVYCLATKEEQARLVVNDARTVIRESAEVNDIYEMLMGRSTLYVKGTNRTSFIKPLGSDSKRLDGLNPLSVICDELHAWQKRELWDVMEDAFGCPETVPHDSNNYSRV